MLPAFLLSCLPLLASASPDINTTARLFQRVRGCVFEVVVRKLPDSGATYAQPLPYDKLTWQERKDSVWSIGSAFAVGKDTVLTAAHVLQAGLDDPDREPMLRDAQGRTYRLGRFLKYSTHEDFALFTVPGLSIAKPLRPARSIEIGTPVYAVGNALGEGIVLRDGLLTSSTPEDQNGEWKAWRFSAAASPGNSGGPLVDVEGGVVGVVQMKSQAENLNYALPMDVVTAFPSGRLRFRERSTYVHPDLGRTPLLTIADTVLAIPPAWRELDHQVWNLSDRKDILDRDSLLRAESADHFPAGRSGKLFTAPVFANTPERLTRNDDGWWGLRHPEYENKVDLGGNGVWVSGKDPDFMLAALRLPDAVPVAEMARDSRALGDLLLKGGRLDRHMAGGAFRVTSLGKAVLDSTWTDRWGRPWLVRGWRQPWDGDLLIAAFLPDANGFGVVLTVGSPGDLRSGQGRRLLDVAQSTLTSFSGDVSRWQEWKKHPELLPTFLRTVTVQETEGRVTVQWPGGSLTSPAALVSEPGKALVSVSGGFVRDSLGGTSVQVAAVAIAPSEVGHSLAMALRIGPADSSMGQEAVAEWRRRLLQEAPFDGTPLDQGQGAKMSMRMASMSRKRVQREMGRSFPLWFVVAQLGNAPKAPVLDAFQEDVQKSLKVPTEGWYPASP